ncbi:MAG: class I SAM-dependent methyltransferase [Firmicutes bacterium]|nr:class I SAM-dependent methyltransferase [Bacillota bacterium]
MEYLGWQPYGVEPDSEAARVAKERYNLTIDVGTLDQINYPDSFFDAIVMNHVIEHVPDPVALFQQCRRLLRPGGKLALLTPNVKSLGSRLFHSAWRGLEPPRHLHLFSPKALGACAKQAGLQIDFIRTSTYSASTIWKMSRIIKNRTREQKGEKPPRRSRVGGLIFQAIEEIVWVIWPTLGEEILMIATKINGAPR